MNEQECLSRMIAPGQVRHSKWRGGILQIHVTRACDKACYACTQNSNLGGRNVYMTLADFETACQSLEGYWGVVGVFGGNPAMHPKFAELCAVLRRYFPMEQRGLWCNNPLGYGKEMAKTFNPMVSNLNVHLDQKAYVEFKRDWPASRPFGLDGDSRHSPPFVAMKDVLRKPCLLCGGSGLTQMRESAHIDAVHGTLLVGSWCRQCNGTGQVYDEERAWELISSCDINQHWSALVGVTPYGLRAYFCEIAYSQAALHPEWPDSGLSALPGWWRLPMEAFAEQVRQHCHSCGVPLRRFGQLAVGGSVEEVSATHADAYKPKDKNRRVELVTVDSGSKLALSTDYIGNARR